MTSHTVVDTIDINGKCKRTTFKSDKGEWQNALVQAKF